MSDCRTGLPSNIKINDFWNFFFILHASSGLFCSKRFFKMLILDFLLGKTVWLVQIAFSFILYSTVLCSALKIYMFHFIASYACFFLFRKVCHNSNDVDDFSARLLFKIAPAWNNMLHHAFCRKDSLLCWLHSKSKIFRKVQFYFSKNISNSFNWSSDMKGLMLDDERFFLMFI